MNLYSKDDLLEEYINQLRLYICNTTSTVERSRSFDLYTYHQLIDLLKDIESVKTCICNRLRRIKNMKRQFDFCELNMMDILFNTIVFKSGNEHESVEILKREVTWIQQKIQSLLE